MDGKITNPIGAHFSVGKGFLVAFKEAVSIGADAMQVFAKSPMQAKLRKITSAEAQEIKNFSDRAKVRSLVIHASYLLNFAKPISPDGYELRSLAEDLFNAEALGGIGAVVHMGKFLKLNRGEAIKNFVSNIKKVLNQTSGSSAKIILENTAGQGSEFGFRLDELAEIYKTIGNSRVKICLDTEHLFAAGYDLSDKEECAKTIEEIEKYFSIKNIACVHLNDAKKPLGSRVDRHEDIGHGLIGSAGLSHFIKALNDSSMGIVPLILETPQGFSFYKKQIAEVRTWF